MKILVFLLLLAGSLLSCSSGQVDVKLVDSNDTIPRLENRLNLSLRDTCIVEYYWFNYSDNYRQEERRIVTKRESQQRLKKVFIWTKTNTPYQRLLSGATYNRAVIIKKY